jgi:hypothetical protein
LGHVICSGSSVKELEQELAVIESRLNLSIDSGLPSDCNPAVLENRR